MKRILLGSLGIIVLIIAGIFFVKGSITGTAITETILLGYCPTMQPIAEEIAKNNANVKLSPKESSNHALNDLNRRTVDIALIGRLAKDTEIGPSNQRMLQTGYTLITTQKSSIQKKDLTAMTIHTYVPENVVKELLPESQVIFHKDKKEAISKMENHPVLIEWSDYDNEELLVVIIGNEKDPLFRLPVLYSINQDLEDINVNQFKAVEASKQ